jgi:hypothetical protein
MAVVRIKCEVGGSHRHQSCDLGPQPHHTTPAECRMVGHRDQREGPATQRVPRIDDSDGLFRCDAVTYRGSYVVEVCPPQLAPRYGRAGGPGSPGTWPGPASRPGPARAGHDHPCPPDRRFGAVGPGATAWPVAADCARSPRGRPAARGVLRHCAWDSPGGPTFDRNTHLTQEQCCCGMPEIVKSKAG